MNELPLYREKTQRYNQTIDMDGCGRQDKVNLREKPERRTVCVPLCLANQDI